MGLLPPTAAYIVCIIIIILTPWTTAGLCAALKPTQTPVLLAEACGGSHRRGPGTASCSLTLQYMSVMQPTLSRWKPTQAAFLNTPGQKLLEKQNKHFKLDNQANLKD